MNKKLLLLFTVLALFVLATSGFGQACSRAFYYFDNGEDPAEPPLGCPCTTGPALADGVTICLYWDNDNNGPDADDPLPPPEQEPTDYCFTFNGNGAGIGEGHFFTPVAVGIEYLPADPNLCHYYLRINSGGCCYESITYLFATGVEEIFMSAADWTCANEECETPPNPQPNPPTNVVASDNTECLSVHVSWAHDSLNVTGFNIYAGAVLVGTTGSQVRARSVNIYDNVVHSFTVKAVNTDVESNASNADNGSTYLLNFADGPDGNISGDLQSGTTHTIHFVRPTVSCPSRYSLWTVNLSGSRVDSLAADTIQFPTDPDTIRFTLPTRADTISLRLLVDATYTDIDTIQVVDTSDTAFRLGAVGTGEPIVIPTEFALSQNYPNPFNPETRIEFAVPYQSNIKIEVYNISGQLVTTLVDGSFIAGVHHIAWNGRSNEGIDVGSGLYFYRMSGPDFVQTKKMLMLK